MILHKCFTYYVLHIYKTEQVAIALWHLSNLNTHQRPQIN
jgi:hypothetical protein